ncbi:hypothetical protein NV379_02245 [Paenibacillus sp. N1-5-1-14]|uniref:hypothetical protein n=1 Tax=Paenibacillus radicibacter TaxID=2972488 RepID=UPI0021599C2F|nr:hypothetical protein [Paenibacillus radicibacter]MCR8641467.1 hypothetical protein [Paenibacillus radicibacter]
MPIDGKKEEHESFGMLGFSRTSGGYSNLFGSSIKHQHTITMRLRHAIKERDLNKDWYYGKSEIVEVEMSQNQFAELITSMNMGDGVPVTIRRLNGKRMDNCPEENKREIFEKEFEERMVNLSERLEKITEDAERILEDKTAPKKSDKELILKQLSQLRQEVSSNIPFVAASFNEQMDKTVTEAKGEVEAFVMNKVHSLGIEGLKAEFLSLSEGKSE